MRQRLRILLRRRQPPSRAFCQPLGLRWNHLLTVRNRNFSAVTHHYEASGAATSHQQSHDDGFSQREPTEPSTETKPRRRNRRVFIYSAIFLTIGLVLGSYTSMKLVPPPIPAADTDESELLLSKLRKDVGELSLVKELRSRRDEWLEYEAYMSQAPESKASSMSAGAMRGYGGLGIQRVFWNKEQRKLVSVVFLGGALTGWPTVVHGGAVATVLQENLERVANGPEFGSGSDHADASLVLENFKIQYRRPSLANAMYVVQAEVEEVQEPGRDGKQQRVKATLQHCLTKTTCAEASGCCVPRAVR